MSFGPTTRLPTVAVGVGDALRRAGIQAVLTGGACASLHTRGGYSSVDADFILLGEVERRQLDDALASLGFRRSGDRYVHPGTEFYVEFPRGPLASCRDRLAAFYHWNDRQSLEVAIRIAARNRVRWSKIQSWSATEGHSERYQEFLRAAQAARRLGS